MTWLKWKRPVRAGDVLTARAEVLTTRDLRSRPDLGIVCVRVTATNQKGDEVVEWENPILFARREPAA